jgi:antitoxin VapB
MAILIKDREADRLIRTLVERTGESITEAVKRAVRDRLEALPPSDAEIAARRRKIEEIIERGRKLPIVDDRTADEIIGYNAHGHFD